MSTSIAANRFNEPVTRHMHQDLTRLEIGQTVGEVLINLRRDPPRGRVIYFYVVDAENRLQGVIPTRRLLLAALEAPIADVMVRDVVVVPAEASLLEACEFFIQHRFLAFPVVDSQRHVLGVVDVDLYTEGLGQLNDGVQRDDLFQMIGVHAAGAQHASAWRAFRIRFPWLGCNLGAGILAAFLAGVYERELNKVVELAFFIPVVLNLAESVSSQSVSLSLQALHGGLPGWREVLKQLRREFLTGTMLGVGSGAIIALVAIAWLGKPAVALCLMGGISGGVAAAAVFGLVLPFLLKGLRLEPRVAAGPIALAAADVWTMLLYLNLARWLVG